MGELLVYVIVILMFFSVFGFLGSEIYKDAKRRKLDKPLFWAIISSIPMFGIIAYMMQHSKQTEVILCKNCKGHLSELLPVCPYCGADLGVYCKKCNHILQPDGGACESCQTPIGEVEQAMFFEKFELAEKSAAWDKNTKMTVIITALISTVPLTALIIVLLYNYFT